MIIYRKHRDTPGVTRKGELPMMRERAMEVIGEANTEEQLLRERLKESELKMYRLQEAIDQIRERLAVVVRVQEQLGHYVDETVPEKIPY